MLQHTTKSVRHLEKEGLRYKLGHCCKPSCVTDGRPSAVIDQKGNPSMYITKETSCSKEIESSLHEGAYQMFFFLQHGVTRQTKKRPLCTTVISGK